MRASFLVMAVFGVSPAAFAAKTDDAALTRFMKRSPESVRWAQKRCGDAPKAAGQVTVSTLSRCARERLGKLLADSEKMREQDEAEEAANSRVPHESWNRMNDPGADPERDEEQEPGFSASEF